MTKEQLEQKISENNAAYAAGIPFITDYEYDLLWQQLYNIDPTNDLLYHTAQQRTNLTGLTWHKYPIYGTNKAFNMLDLKPFLTRFGDQQLVIEPKYDGCAAVITHTKSGWRITLEGDGHCGSDITHLTSYIQCPFHLRHFQAIEILIPLKDWNPDYGKNPRNVVSGWTNPRRHEKPPAKMTAVPHNFGFLSELYTYNGDLENFSELLLTLFSKWSKIYSMDGLMIKVSDEKLRLVAGNNGQTNNWSIAWKPPIQTKWTTVIDIEWNVSRLGRIIPTVVYESIELCSTTNSRVTGNNAQWIKDRQIIIGSKILVGKAGEIIPKILEVKNSHLNLPVKQGSKTPQKHPGNHGVTRLAKKGSVTLPKTKSPTRTDFNILPTHCPKCKESLTWEGVHLVCKGEKCIVQLINSIEYFYSHKGIVIDGLGEATIEKLLQNQKIYKVLSDKIWALLDISSYDISAEVFSILGEKTFMNLMKQLFQINKTKTMANFISGLGLPGVSYKTTLRLCQYIKSGKLSIKIPRKAIESFFKGITIFDKAKEELKNFQFAPLPEIAKAIYCITGTLSQPRNVMIEYFSESGYEFSANVTRITNYLIVGADPGKLKRRYAEKYKIPQITEEQFIKLLAKEN